MTDPLDTLRPEVKTMLNDLSAEDVRALFIYDETTGILRWRQSRRHGIEAGAEAGCFDRKGYRSVTVNSRHYRVHRIIWLYMTGKWPIHQVDHINGAHADNRWVNLRDATNAENQQNAKLRSTNTSGLRGVSWYARDGKWRAQIKHEGVSKTIGYFETPEGAHAAYLDAKAKAHTFQPVPREYANG